MIKAKNLSLKMDGKNILENIDLSISKGKFTALIGPNGAGKSSLLKCLTGLTNINIGEVSMGDKKISDYSVAELSKKRAVLSQNLEVSFPFSVEEIVMMGRSPYIVKCESIKDKQIVESCLEKVGLLNFEDRRFATLSGGEKQRVQLARVLAQIISNDNMGDKYLFLDEPTSALDLRHQSEMMKLVKNLSDEKGLTVFAIVHDINLASKFADNVVMLKDGSVISSGITSEVMTEKNLKKLYGVEIDTYQSNNQQFFIVA